MSTTIQSCELARTSAELYGDSLLPKSLSSVLFEQSQSVTSLSTLSSDPETFQPCDDMPLPEKRALPTSRVIESVSAPRHLHFKKAILQSQQLLEQQQHLIEKETSEISCKKTELSEECVSEKNTTQTADDHEVPSKTPVARTLPVVAITNSIASLTVGRQSMSNGKVQEQPVWDNSYDKTGEDRPVLSFIPSHLSSYRYQVDSKMQRLPEDHACFKKDWRPQQKPSLNCGIPAGHQSSHAKYKDLQEIDFIEECEMHASVRTRGIWSFVLQSSLLRGKNKV